MKYWYKVPEDTDRSDICSIRSKMDVCRRYTLFTNTCKTYTFTYLYLYILTHNHVRTLLLVSDTSRLLLKSYLFG